MAGGNVLLLPPPPPSASSENRVVGGVSGPESRITAVLLYVVYRATGRETGASAAGIVVVF